MTLTKPTTKLTLWYKKDFYALFSNAASKNENEFYLVMVFHKSKKGGFGEPITVEQCEKALKRYNPNFKYVEI